MSKSEEGYFLVKIWIGEWYFGFEIFAFFQRFSVNSSVFSLCRRTRFILSITVQMSGY